jgi:hypothetical protein
MEQHQDSIVHYSLERRLSRNKHSRVWKPNTPLETEKVGCGGISVHIPSRGESWWSAGGWIATDWTAGFCFQAEALRMFSSLLWSE